jgi:hypothetical protein
MSETVYILTLAVIAFVFAFAVVAGPKVKGEDVRLLLACATILPSAINLLYIPSSPMNDPGMQGFFATLAFYLLVSLTGFVAGKWWRAHFVSAKKIRD